MSEFSGVAAGREKIRIETVLDGHDFGLSRCSTCGAKTASLSQFGQCLPCEMKFTRTDRAVLR